MKTSTFLLSLASALALAAQTPTAQPGRGAPPARPPAFPPHPLADSATIDRGRALYGVNCNFCHGSDARGGEGGPNLLRSETVLNDKNGELIAAIVQNGRGDMPKINLTKDQVSDVAAYIHSFYVGGYDVSRMKPPSILVGDSKAGEADFKKTCGGCHSATGDLKGLAAKISDPKSLQNAWLFPSTGGRGRGGSPLNVPPVRVKVTQSSGQTTEGTLYRIDDFVVTLIDSDGIHHSFRRDGDTPKVELLDPLKPHRDLLPRYTDQQIHDITAYLVTLK